ncbi:MAG: hypothetical protein RIT02_130 [Planctomycetota bacterium]|jgi:hypothetical protein
MFTKKARKNTWWLIQNETLVSVSPSLDASKEHDVDPQWLAELQKRLQTSRNPTPLLDNNFLPPPEYELTLTFSDGSHGTIVFGQKPPKIYANRVLIDGKERVVMSPGLTEYNHVAGRCKVRDPRELPSTSNSPASSLGILIALIAYFIYLMLK